VFHVILANCIHLVILFILILKCLYYSSRLFSEIKLRYEKKDSFVYFSTARVEKKKV